MELDVADQELTTIMAFEPYEAATRIPANPASARWQSELSQRVRIDLAARLDGGAGASPGPRPGGLEPRIEPVRLAQKRRPGSVRVAIAAALAGGVLTGGLLMAGYYSLQPARHAARANPAVASSAPQAAPAPAPAPATAAINPAVGQAPAPAVLAEPLIVMPSPPPAAHPPAPAPNPTLHGLQGADLAARRVVAGCDRGEACDADAVDRVQRLAESAYALALHSGAPGDSLSDLRRSLDDLDRDGDVSPSILVGNYAVIVHSALQLASAAQAGRPSPPIVEGRR